MRARARERARKLEQAVVVISMLGVGLVCAMVQGWQLTLVGLAIRPIFAGMMMLQTGLHNKCEMLNKRETIAKGYYDAIANVRGIRSMTFERVFASEFERAADEALLFYVGAILMARIHTSRW